MGIRILLSTRANQTPTIALMSCAGDMVEWSTDERWPMTLPDFLSDDDGWIHVTGHRIGLHELIHFYNEGFSAEMLMGAFPTLPLATIHKVLAFYLENQEIVDEHIRGVETELQRQRASASRGPSIVELRKRLEAMRRAGA
jgi:uncharacterized protein (DUF433 family)